MTNLKAILAAASAAMLLASPVMAKSHHPRVTSAARAQGAAVGRGAYVPPYYAPVNEGGPYTPSAPTPPHGYSNDFQDQPR